MASERVLITGCGGMLGASVYAACKRRFEHVLATDIDLNEPWLEPMDVRDIAQCQSVFERFRPTLVLHLAALTDLEGCEKDAENSWLTNALGAENVAILSQKSGAAMVYISTAGIFGGEQEQFNDFDRPNPLSIYAKSKYHGEQFVERHVSKYFVFRAGWMMGGGLTKDKKFINKIYKQIKAGKQELFVVDDKLGTPTYTKDFAESILKVVDSGYYGLYNQVCGGSCSRLDVAREFLELIGLSQKIRLTTVSSDYFKQEYFAVRPYSEKLVNLKLNARNINFMRDWKVCLAEYSQVFKRTIMAEYDFVVLGAGVAGLAFAKRVSEHGHSVLILEKEKEVGGLSRTLYHNGFYLDFCAHRFHTNNKKLLDEVLTLPGMNMTRHIKKSRIYMFGKYLKYPFEIQNLLRAMPLSQSVLSGFSFAKNYAARAVRKKPNIRSYRDWFIDLYGERLYDVMCYPYTSKIWRMDPANISADWADQRFQGEAMAKLVKRVLKKLLTLDFSSYSIEDDALAPDGGIFYYPQKGIQELPDGLNTAAKNHGAITLTEAKVTKIHRGERTVTYEHNGQQHVARYGDIISTIPLPAYYYLQEQRDPQVEAIFKQLKYMDIIFVYAFINRPNISNDHWLYFPDKDVIFNRAVEFSNWSPEMCPPGKTSVCFDITTYENYERWQMSDEALAERTLEDSYRSDYLKRGEVESTYVHRVRYAYPVYDLNYQERLEKVVKFLEDPHSYLVGRTGIFRYNNSDNSIEMAFQLGDNFVENRPKKTIFNYEIKQISL